MNRPGNLQRLPAGAQVGCLQISYCQIRSQGKVDGRCVRRNVLIIIFTVQLCNPPPGISLDKDMIITLHIDWQPERTRPLIALRRSKPVAVIDSAKIQVIAIAKNIVFTQNHIIHPPVRVGTAQSCVDDSIANRQPLAGSHAQRSSDRSHLQIGCWLRLNLYTRAGLTVTADTQQSGIIVFLTSFVDLVIGIRLHKKLVLPTQIPGQRHQSTV